MYRINNNYFHFFVSTYFLEMSCQKKHHHSHKHHHSGRHGHCRKSEPIVGAWLYNQETAGTDIYGSYQINANGTYVKTDTVMLTQSLPAVDENGFFFTIETGTWRKVGKRKYQMVGSAMILKRSTDCSTGLPLDPPDLAAPACPFARTKNSSVFTIDNNNNQGQVLASTTLHPPNDLTVSQPFPFPTVESTITMERLQY
jgi:hypothetical protein